ncbi:MAG: phosphopyruvate hydratase [Clostridia bacterium]|nr:phosphopyruvate hydratase [Clostridia bacterium]
MKTKIIDISAIEILDSRGNPTVEATVTLECGATGCASVPSGASVGKYEAVEMRDGDGRFSGRGVLSAVDSVCTEIRDRLMGEDAARQEQIDLALIELDGTDDKRRLGANAILATSLATARAAASGLKLPLYKHLGGAVSGSLPCPMMNIMNGGAHASNNLEIQEFMIVPSGICGFSEQLRAGAETYRALGKLLESRGYSTAVGDEGGFAPTLSSDEAAMDFILEAISLAGYGTEEVKLAIDVAASGWYTDHGYKMTKSGRRLAADELIEYYAELIKKYPIVSIEDGLGEEDIDGWRELTEKLSGRVMLVGDDLFVTNEKRVRMGIDCGLGNAILIKPNQIGTLTETAKVIRLGGRHGYKTIASHRSGDTEDSFIADLSVGLGTEYIKSGAPCRSERLAKYNRLLKIENEFQ